MSDTQQLRSVVRPDPEEREALEELRSQVDGMFEAGYQPCLIGPDGTQTEIPASAFAALRIVIDGMASGKTMVLFPSGAQLTTAQAAEMLQMSRPHLIKLLDHGEIPFERVGTHRRLNVEDVIAYREKRAQRRREQLRELSRYSAEHGGGYR